MSISPKLQARIDKLLKLVEQGIGGERDNAMRRLEALCNKHNVSMDELLSESENLDVYWFRYDNPHVRLLLLHICEVIDGPNSHYKSSDKQRQMGFELTESQHAEYVLYYETLRPALKQHIDDSVSAFIHVNRLYRPSAKSRSWKDMTEEEITEAKRILGLADAVDPTAVHKRLENQQ